MPRLMPMAAHLFIWHGVKHMAATAAHVQGFYKDWRKDWVAGRAFKVVFTFAKDVSSGYKAAFAVKNASGTELATAFDNGSTTNTITIGSFASGVTTLTIDIPGSTIPASTAAQEADCEFVLFSTTTASNYFPLFMGKINIIDDVVTSFGV